MNKNYTRDLFQEAHTLLKQQEYKNYITKVHNVPSNTKESKVFQELIEQGFTPWKWTGEEWIKEPVRKIETSNKEVSND